MRNALATAGASAVFFAGFDAFIEVWNLAAGFGLMGAGLIATAHFWTSE